MFETTPRTMIGTAQRRTSATNQQPRRLLMALLILLVALVVLLVKDRQFWFGTEQATIDSDMPATAAADQSSATTATRKAAVTPQKKQGHSPVSASTQTAPQNESAPVTVSRSVLPPLDVDVIAGDKHRSVHPSSSATHVELEKAAPTTNAAEREALPATSQPQTQVTASYPVLAQHMNVQGSVVLQAVISAEGLVENLRVLSGPGILTAAAQQAVREWRFKPIVQNGHAVETQARITVNFSIKVADNSASTTLADSRGSDLLIISR